MSTAPAIADANWITRVAHALRVFAVLALAVVLDWMLGA